MLNYMDEIFLWTLCKLLVINVKKTLFHLQNTTLDYKCKEQDCQKIKNVSHCHVAIELCRYLTCKTLFTHNITLVIQNKLTCQNRPLNQYKCTYFNLRSGPILAVVVHIFIYLVKRELSLISGYTYFCNIFVYSNSIILFLSFIIFSIKC